VTYKEELERIWSDQSQKSLEQIITTSLSLLSAADAADEVIPAELALDIYLQANTVLGYGGAYEEGRALAQLFHQLVNQLSQNELVLAEPPKLHKLGCVLCASVISIMTGDEHDAIRTAHHILSWEDYNSTTSQRQILGSLQRRLIASLNYAPASSWKLELISFIVILGMLRQDLGADELFVDTQRSAVTTALRQISRDSAAWQRWEREWLEKSDYYRFVTLMMTNSTVSEEVLLDVFNQLLQD